MKERVVFKLPAVLGYVQFLKRKFLRVCPYGDKYLNTMVRKTVQEVCLMSALVTMILILWNVIFDPGAGVFILGSVLFGIYLVSMEIPNYKIQERETLLYQELILYLSRVKHKYLSCHHIPNSIYDASEGMSYEIRQHAGVIYRILMDCDRKEEVRDYVLHSIGNRYLKLFLVQAYEASEKGDISLSEDSSLFADNVEFLRMEMMEELYRRKQRAYEFAGYTFVTVTPVFMMPLLKRWGLDFAPELESFYTELGKIIELITFCTTVVLYGFINRAKEITLSGELYEGTVNNLEWLFQNPLVRRLSERLERQEGKVSNKIREMLLQSGAKISYGRFLIVMAGTATVTALFLAVTYSDILISLAGGVFAGLLPLLHLWYQLKTVLSEALYEIKQFQAVAIMERRLNGVTMLGMLEDMEVFSKIFRGVLRTCINSYSSGPETALQRMKEEGGKLHNGFVDLAEAFLSVDNVGIFMAFAEVEHNRVMLEKMSQMETQINLEKKKDSMDILSKIPMVLTVGAYFILPFFLFSLQGVFEVFELLEKL